MTHDFAFALNYPWSLYDPDTRPKLSASEPLTLDAAGSLLVAANEEVGLTVRRGVARLEPEGPPFRWSGARWRLFSLPAPLTARDLNVVLAGDALLAGEALLRHSGKALRETEDDFEQEAVANERAAALVDQLVGLIDLLYEESQTRVLGLGRLRWDDVAELWLEKRRQAAEPRMAVIVRHAERFPRRLVELVERPRRVLERIRHLQPAARIQELDRACIGWYVRQPGTTLAEKAGPRQRLLAVVRRESRDTLENRVLRDLLRRSVGTARRYVASNARFPHSHRFRLVKRYASLCRRLSNEPSIGDVKHLTGLPSPNYPLLFDDRYRRVWQAWQEILRAQEVLDEAWRWQRRLWADIVRIATTAAMTRRVIPQGGRTHVFGASPLELRTEQARGRYSMPVQLCALVTIDNGERRCVVEVFDVSALDLTQPPLSLRVYEHRLLAIGAVLLLHLQDLASDARLWIPVWSVHAPGGVSALKQMVSSASRALGELVNQERVESGQKIRAFGLVIASQAEGEPEFDFGERVAGLSLCVDEEGFADGVYLLRSFLIEAIQSHL